jgi:hypothetical protein
MLESALIAGLGAAILAGIIYPLVWLGGWSRLRSARADFLRALESPSTAKQFRKARFDPDINLRAFRDVLLPRLNTPLGEDVLVAIRLVAPELVTALDRFRGRHIIEALAEVEGELCGTKVATAARKITDADIGKRGLTELMYAAAEGDVDRVTKLLATAPNVNAQDDQGKTSLIYAAMNNQPEIIRLLLEKGASPALTTATGRSANWFARKQGFEEVARVLEEHRTIS